jgi:tripartite-type tricarboxylate transporter receptor subunit TctC
MLMKSAGVKITHAVSRRGARGDGRHRRAVKRHVRGPAGDLAVRKGRQGQGVAMASPKRSVYFPDVPTTKEAGYANVELAELLRAVPAGPDAARHRRETARRRGEDRQHARRARKARRLRGRPAHHDAEEFTRFRADIEMWGRVVKDAGVKVD